MTTRHGLFSRAFLLLALGLGLGLMGCEGDDGAPGVDGISGLDGTDGQACWDLNNNGAGDPEEDLNGDTVVDVYDCNAFASGAYEIGQLHAGYFTEHTYDGTQSCLNCHGKLADEFLTTAHWKWEGVSSNIEGFENGPHGKNDILNNFCIAVPSNEGRCTHCHAGYGYADDTFDFGDPKNIDCLICHDQTGGYAKDLTTAGLPKADVDLQAVARSVAMNGGRPTIDNCIFCHANAGGGNNVKHGDLAMSLADTTREYDVHMGIDGGNLECIDCHQVKRDADGNFLSHGIGGMPYHSVDEGNMKQCGDCHPDRANIHAGTTAETILGSPAHTKLACQVCHIPTFARQTSTKTEWYWERAGMVLDPAPGPDPVDPTRPSFDRKKGDFVWAFNVRPTLRFFNGKYTKALIGVNDTYTSEPAVLAAPVGDCNDPNAMIYPFKKMIGNQPADVVNQRILVPHLFGTAGGPNPFWGNWDWDLALLDASLITGQPYQSGDYGFVSTEMYLSVNHEIAPKEEAYGFGNACEDCHSANGVDWAELGYTGDPTQGGVCQ